MKTFLLWITSLILAMGSVCRADTPRVIEAEIRGTINPAGSRYLEQAIRHAEDVHAQALIVRLDTPGGLLSSVREMSQSIDQSTVPVVVFVFPAGAAATSAGAILTLSSHIAAMAPGTAIGAAHPVGPSGEEIKGPMGDKVLNDTAAFVRGMAEVRGRPTDLADAIVVKSRSFTADEAFQKKLIEIQAGDMEQLLTQLDGREVTTRDGKEKNPDERGD